MCGSGAGTMSGQGRGGPARKSPRHAGDDEGKRNKSYGKPCFFGEITHETGSSAASGALLKICVHGGFSPEFSEEFTAKGRKIASWLLSSHLFRFP